MFDRRKFIQLGLAGIAAAGWSRLAAAAAMAGRDYAVIAQPLPVETGDKVEVLELFWYGCPHCFELEPKLAKWVKALPKDVEFRRMPAIFRDTWVPGAKLFYALEALGELQRLNSDVFDAIHVENKDLNDEQSLANWMVSKGVDRKKFLDTFNSFNVQTKAKRAEQLTRQSKIQGVPALIIDGRYATSGAMVGGHEQMLAVADELIQKARGERKKK